MVREPTQSVSMCLLSVSKPQRGMRHDETWTQKNIEGDVLWTDESKVEHATILDTNRSYTVKHKLWQNLNRWFVLKLSRVAELKMFCRKTWLKFLHSDFICLFAVVAKYDPVGFTWVGGFVLVNTVPLTVTLFLSFMLYL